MKIPPAILAQHLAVLGKTGSGKSSVLRLLVESLLERNERVCVIDPKGDWYGLKSSRDGTKAGYPVVIFGGAHADVPLNAHAGASVAELVATGNRPCVIDLGGWMVGERTRFFLDFASALFRNNAAPLRLVMDEVHNFAPQGKVLDPDAGKMLHWANRLASEGRGKGITILSASQRPQKVHKDFLTCAETLIAMRVIHVLDRTAIKEWIDGAGDPAMGKEVLATLAAMPRGEGWLWSPEAGIGPERIQFPLFKTYDSFAAPTGETRTLKGWAEVDLADVKAKLAAVVEEAKANDPKELRKRIADLEKQLYKSAKPVQTVDQAAVDRAVAGAVAARDREWQAAIKERETIIGSLTGRMAKIEQLAHVNGDATPKSETPSSLTVSPAGASRTLTDKTGTLASSGQQGALQGNRALPSQVRQTPLGRKPAGGSTNVDLPKGEAATLQALIQYPDGLRREQLTVLTGYKRSSRDAYLQRLREKGYVEQTGDLMRATDDGQAAMPDAAPLPTGDELQAFWLARLPAGEKAILEVLLNQHPNTLRRDELDELTGYKRSSRDAYLQRLAAKELIVEPNRGEVRATDQLF